jgi:calcium-dependent protein kinase
LARKTYSTKCDIWSIGVIFYELLTGETPWKGMDEKDLLRNIINKQLTIRNTTVSKFCEELLKKILILEEKDRISWEELFEIND